MMDVYEVLYAVLRYLYDAGKLHEFLLTIRDNDQKLFDAIDIESDNITRHG